jgi:hypothetical protein
MQQTQTRIHISASSGAATGSLSTPKAGSPSQADRLVSIIGATPEALLAALTALLTAVQPVADSHYGLSVLMPNDALPYVRGRKGSTQGIDCEAVMTSSGLSVSVSGMWERWLCA